MSDRPPRGVHHDIAARLRKVRIIYGPTITAFCQTYKFTVSQWANYEAGFIPSLASAKQLKRQIPGLTLDWIYEGDTSGLTVMMTRILNATPDEDASPRKP